MRGWRQPWIVCGLVTFTLFAPTETPAQSEGTYTLSVPVNEVSLTFQDEVRFVNKPFDIFDIAA
jgi:hypothetical protein